MRTVAVLIICMAGTCLARSNGQSRAGSPTGMRGGFADRSARRSTSVFTKTAKLVRVTPDALRKDYEADVATCAVSPKGYVALRMAEAEMKLNRNETLKVMCVKKTSSFAKALSSGAIRTNALIADKVDLTTKEQEYQRQISEAMKK